MPPLQPNPPSPSTDSPSAAQLPLLAPEMPTDEAESEGQPNRKEPDPEGVCADPASRGTPDGVGDCAADGSAAETPAGSDTKSLSFDPDALVDFGDGNAEAARAVWEQAQNQALAAAFRRTAEPRKASGGPPFLGWFADEAIPAAKGRYRFEVDREQLLAAVTHLAAFAGRPKKSTPTVRIALCEDLCKLSVAGSWGQSVAIALPLKQIAEGFEPGDASVAFTLPLPKLVDIVRSGEPGVPERLELNGGRRRLLIRGRRELLRVHAGMPNQLMQPLIGTPEPVGMLSPLPLAQGLRLVEQVVTKSQRPREPGAWSRAYIRDGIVIGRHGRVFAVLQAPGLAGLEAMVHATDLGPASTALRRLDSSRTGHFRTQNHSVLTDELTWVSLLTKPDIVSSDQNSAVLRYLLQHEPSDAIVVAGSWLLQALGRLLAAGKGEDGAHLVRLRVTGADTFARLVLQIADKPKS